MKYSLLSTFILCPLLLSACGGSGDDDPVMPERGNGQVNSWQGDGFKAYKSFAVQTANHSDILAMDKTNNHISYDVTQLPHGLGESKGRIVSTDNNGKSLDEDVTIRYYRGFHASVFETSRPKTVMQDMVRAGSSAGLRGWFIQSTDFLPNSGIFVYKGTAFNNNPANDAVLNYTIDYGRRRGSGEIAAAGEHGRLVLEEAPIRYYSDVIGGVTAANGVKGGTVSGSAEGTYNLGIAGPNAEEIVGDAIYGGSTKEDHVLNFYGTH